MNGGNKTTRRSNDKRVRTPIGVLCIAVLLLLDAASTLPFAVMNFGMRDVSRAEWLSLSLVPMVLGLASLGMGAALLTRRSWAWFGAVALVLIDVAWHAGLLTRNITSGSVPDDHDSASLFITLAVYVGLLAYLLAPGVRRFFRIASSSHA